MNKHAMNAFMSEIRWQSQIALWCFDGLRREIDQRKQRLEEMNAFLEAQPDRLSKFTPGARKEAEIKVDEISGCTIRTLMHLQGLLAATGIISEIFWPNTTRGTQVEIRARERRGRVLRTRTKTQEDSALHFRPGGADDARGGLLHVDEMIDNALAVNDSQRIDRFSLGSFEAMAESFGWSAPRAVRALDDENLTLAVRARETDLIAVESEIKRLNSHIRRATFMRLEHSPVRRPGDSNVGISFGTRDFSADELVRDG